MALYKTQLNRKILMPGMVLGTRESPVPPKEVREGGGLHHVLDMTGDGLSYFPDAKIAL